MKKILIYSLLLTSAGFMGSCSASFLDRYPTNALPTPLAINNYTDAVTALSGMYYMVRGTSGNQTYYGARLWYYGDVRGDDMQAQKMGNRSSSCYEMRYTLGDAPNMWDVPYDCLRRANNIIAAIEEGKVTDASVADVNDIKGQALAIRGLIHFDLARIYGKPYTADNGASLGPAIVLDPVDADYKPSRNTVAETYAQAIKDLTDAASLLSKNKNAGYMNYWAAKALLARIYLYKGDNANALSAAQEVITQSPYTLWSTDEYVNAWQKSGNSEMIFELITKAQDSWVDREAVGYLLAEGGYADYVMTKKFADFMQEDPDDVRLGVMLPAAAIGQPAYGSTLVYLNKFPGREDYSPQDVRVNNVPVLRLSETYLIAAEAAVKQNQPSVAAGFLNAIVLRANPNSEPVLEPTLDRILDERRKELVGEGHRFFDLLRNGKMVVRYTNDADQGFHLPLDADSRSFDVNYFRVLLPIPQSEMTANGNMVQNPGY